MEHTYNDETFSDKLSEAIEKLKLTERDVAEYLEVSPSTIIRWLEGTTEPHPTIQSVLLDHLQKLQEDSTGV